LRQKTINYLDADLGIFKHSACLYSSNLFLGLSLVSVLVFNGKIAMQ